MLLSYYLALLLCSLQVSASPISRPYAGIPSRTSLSSSSESKGITPPSHGGVEKTTTLHINDNANSPSPANYLIQSQPRCKFPSSLAICWPRRIYGFFLARPRLDPETIDRQSGSGSPGIDPSRTNTQNRGAAAYATVQPLQGVDRLLAPLAILLVMSWLAVVAVGIVEVVSIVWEWLVCGDEKGGLREYERVVFDRDDVLEELVIEAVQAEEDEDWEYRLKL